MSDGQPTKSNWAEKTSAVSNVLQNIQLQELHSTLRATGALQAEKLQRELNERQVSEREDKLREHIWQMEQGLDQLLNNPEVTPCARFILSKQTQDLLARFGITTASFRQFADKDRLNSFINRLERAVQKANGQMSVDQKNDTDTYLRWMAEAQELESLAQKLQTESDKKDRQLAKAKQLKETAAQNLNDWCRTADDLEQQKGYALRQQQREHRQQGEKRIAAWLLPTIGAWVLGGVLPVYSFDADSIEITNVDCFVLGLIFLSLAVVFTVHCIQLGRRLEAKLEPEKTFQEQIAIAETNLKTTEAEITRLQRWVDSPWEPEAFGKFKVKDLPELEQLKRDRDVFVEQFRLANGLSSDDSFYWPSTEPLSRTVLSPEIQALAHHPLQQKIAAIKLYREQNPGTGLAEAKEAVEALMDRSGTNRQTDDPRQRDLGKLP